MSDSAPSVPLAPGRLMLVHAHPDDESSTTGATMAAYAAAGARVTLVTCTLGEEGEVLVEDLSHLASARDDALGDHRLGELTEAMAVLGVTDFVRLGGDHRFRDSGMAYEDGRVVPAADPSEDCFWRTDLLTAADELVTLIRDRRPHVIITYNQIGGYGHPDHIQAHRVAMYAAQLAAAPTYRRDTEAWAVDRIVWSAWSAGPFRAMIRRARAEGDTEFFGDMDPDGELPPMVLPDEAIDCVVDGSAFAAVKARALGIHATQVAMDSGFFAHMSAGPEWGREDYVLGAGAPFPAQDGPAGDVFAGLDVGR